MTAINFKRNYLLGEEYECIKERANQIMGEYLKYPDLMLFNDLDKSVTFTTERLIPAISTDRPRVMLVFSNPHPHSVHQGMFLSPNTRKRKNLFWSTMESADWIIIPKSMDDPKQLADFFLKAQYRGPFELIFYCYYAFPTKEPKDIRNIFGDKYFRQIIEPEAMDEFMKTIQETSVEAVVTFNKGIFNNVSKEKIEHCIKPLMNGELIQSHIKGLDKPLPVFLTFPTGWRFCSMQFRKDSLENIKSAIGKA